MSKAAKMLALVGLGLGIAYVANAVRAIKQEIEDEQNPTGPSDSAEAHSSL